MVHFKYKPTETTQVHDKKHHYFTIKPIKKDFYKEIFLVAERIREILSKGARRKDLQCMTRYLHTGLKILKKYCLKSRGSKKYITIYNNSSCNLCLSVSLFVCPIITQEPLDRFPQNFG